MNSFLLKEICFFLQLLAITNPMNRMGKVEYMEDLEKRMADHKNKSIAKPAEAEKATKSEKVTKPGRAKKCQSKKMK